MPITVKRQDCVGSDGKHGTHVVLKNGKQVSCHSSAGEALASARIRIANAPELSATQKKAEIDSL